MEVEVLYIAGCPHFRPTLDRLHSILTANGLNCAIIQTKVDDFETAQLLRFLGSPAIRINGIDIEATARTRTDFGVMCRTYDGKGVPSELLIKSAIARASEMSRAGGRKRG